ncbi:sulfotransferase [Synechocystis salina LEGE 06099]|uniref:sulfotransferase family protein n=1 Tax=Synechocystis salina TaxID=945780 RepID=UPI001880ACE5|nr:sulfotransferase [Synechocystis salina]MBE9203870.1 sulfotransferase [Synechocystis salina LEGE 06099]
MSSNFVSLSIFKPSFNICFFSFALQSRGGFRILEKSPGHIANESRIFALNHTFPKAKFIFIYRHPIDVFCSWKKLESRGTSKSHTDPLIFISNYKKRIELIERYNFLFPEKFIVINYHDLTTNPKNTFMDICEFIKIQYEESLLEIPPSMKEKRYSKDPLLSYSIFPKKSESVFEK